MAWRAQNWTKKNRRRFCSGLEFKSASGALSPEQEKCIAEFEWNGDRAAVQTIGRGRSRPPEPTTSASTSNLRTPPTPGG